MVEYSPFDHSMVENRCAAYRERRDEAPLCYNADLDNFRVAATGVARQHSSNVRRLQNLPIVLAA